MTEHPGLDLAEVNAAVQEFDTGDADHFELVWIRNKSTVPQPIVWPMRLAPSKQGNIQSALTGEWYVFDPRKDN
jgi:hypothetical protein